MGSPLTDEEEEEGGETDSRYGCLMCDIGFHSNLTEKRIGSMMPSMNQLMGCGDGWRPCGRGLNTGQRQENALLTYNVRH